MDMDIDWCLTCEKHINGSSPYCSLACAGPWNEAHIYSDEDSSVAGDEDDDDVILHTIDPAEPTTSRWLGSDSAGISAWAADIPSGAPPPGDIHSPDDEESSFFSFSRSTYRPSPPNLLKTPRQIVPPSLSMTTPPAPPPTPSTPVVTPKRQQSTASIAPSADASMGQTSLNSAATESSLATPASSNPVPISCASRRPSILDDMYIQVRSWVSPSPAPIPSTQQPQLPVTPMNLPKATPKPRSSQFRPVTIISSSHSSHGFADQSAVYWMAGTVLDQFAIKPPHESFRGRTLPNDIPLRHDDHPSYRTRGRKPSRADA
ncbi:hypothetical protein M413DRAFT_9138 [Hebeloma cylindrosporum]|uniref:Uncharacterized protein n=1 Tax=Hebeloma cylindrosporum TaxID=76867 RepID=A0A0C3CLA4_HEBCY|nr:hypothetical protein M413DRAFT_9138 [Hebeloma cylindrosporum h7]